MNLVVSCKSCKSPISLNKFFVNDRSQIAREKGDEFGLNCQRCMNSNTYHVNEVTAIESNFIAFILLCLFIVKTLVLFFYLKDYFSSIRSPHNVLKVGGVLVIPYVVYKLYMHQERGNVDRFNKYRV